MSVFSLYIPPDLFNPSYRRNITEYISRYFIVTQVGEKGTVWNWTYNSSQDYFLVYDFWTPPPFNNFVHGSFMLDMDTIDHVAAASGLLAVVGPLVCPSRSALFNVSELNSKYVLILLIFLLKASPGSSARSHNLFEPQRSAQKF